MNTNCNNITMENSNASLKPKRIEPPKRVLGLSIEVVEEERTVKTGEAYNIVRFQVNLVFGCVLRVCVQIGYQNPMGIFVKIVLMICILFFTDQVWFWVHSRAHICHRKSDLEQIGKRPMVCIPLVFSQFALGHSYGDRCG